MGSSRHAAPRTQRKRALNRFAIVAMAGMLLISLTGPAGLGSMAGAAPTKFSDDFSRSLATGWGGVSGLGQYQLSGSARFSVSGGHGRMVGILPGKSAEARVATGSLNIQAKSVMFVPAVTPNKLGVYYSLELRRQTNGAAYRATFHIGANGFTDLSISRGILGKETKIAGSLKGPRVAAGQAMTLVASVTGTVPAQVSLSIIRWGMAVPVVLTARDASAARLQSKGDLGIRTYVSGHSISTSVALDSLAISTDRPATAPQPITAPKPITGATYRSASFDSQPLGPVVPANFNSELGGLNKNVAEYDDMSIVADSRGAGRALRTTLRRNTIHSIPSGNNGANFFMPLPAGLDRACMQYDIKFDGAFDWSLGGKLPGLEGVAPGIAPSAPTGGHPTSEGWSGRMMWVGPKAYSWAGSTNMAVSYMYHPGQENQYGDNVRWNKPFVAGKWHTVKQCYSMNTIGKANGLLEAWMDGVIVVDRDNYVYRTDPDVHINYIVWAIFRGGNTIDWAGSRDSYIDIDNVRVTSA